MMDQFKEIWLVDFEFEVKDGERPNPVCMVARELHNQQTFRYFRDALICRAAPPYGIGKDRLFIAYFATAELSCHIELGWPLPENVLDLYVEFRCLTNNLSLPGGRSLPAALQYLGLDWVSTLNKEQMRKLALRGGPWTEEEQLSLLQYCEDDVVALGALFERLLPTIDWPRALLRGRSQKAVASMECAGIPLDQASFIAIAARWGQIQDDLIQGVDQHYRVFEGRSFRTSRFKDWLAKEGIPWPCSEHGQMLLNKETFKRMALRYPSLIPLRDLRVALAQIRDLRLAVGADGRNRTLLSPFSSKSGRNQPSTTKYIFGLAAWSRGLVQAAPGYGVAYVDWSQQEFGIAAALSGDSAMQDAYLSGDPYLAFARQTGAAPSDATRHSHAVMREQHKQCILALQYGMGARGLADRIGKPPADAQLLIDRHRDIYHRYWTWSDAIETYAMLHGRLHTVFGWYLHVTSDTKPGTIRNFPMQANGAEMLRLACCFATERGVTVCGPVHDAILIEAPANELTAAIENTRSAMAEASAIVLGGFVLRTECEQAIYPERLFKNGGKTMWNLIWRRLDPSRVVA